jgi:hypothetical protein
MYVMYVIPNSTAYFINPSHQSVYLYGYPAIVARQRHGKRYAAATNTHATMEELLDSSFSMRSLPYQKKMDNFFFQEFFV